MKDTACQPIAYMGYMNFVEKRERQHSMIEKVVNKIFQTYKSLLQPPGHKAMRPLPPAPTFHWPSHAFPVFPGCNRVNLQSGSSSFHLSQ
jgi:hypothetical protein